MTITIQIDYIANGNHLTQRGSFALIRRKPEQVALHYWKQIQREMSYHAELLKVIMNGDQDITEFVNKLKSQEWNNRFNDNLPF